MAKIHDGSDYQHRQKILPHYQVTALAKKRLKFTIILHLMISFIMGVKLLPTVLDFFNIFWQPIEELYIPLAQSWEWIWFSSISVLLIGLSSMRTNNTTGLKLFIFGILGTCILPIIYCTYYYSGDFRTFVITKDASKASEVWRDYPMALYWYIFVGIACQVHGFELFFAWELLKSMGSHRSINKTK